MASFGLDVPHLCTACNLRYPLIGTSLCAVCRDEVRSDHASAAEDEAVSNAKRVAHLESIREALVQVPHEDHTRDQGPGLRAQHPEWRPGPGVIFRDGGLEHGPELYRLLDCYRRNEIEPVEIVLPPMPAHAGAVMKSVSLHMALVYGLRLAANEDRPMPYAASLAVTFGVATDKGNASYALRSLVRGKVWEYAGSLKPVRAGIDGTKLYRPGTPY